MSSVHVSCKRNNYGQTDDLLLQAKLPHRLAAQIQEIIIDFQA